MFGKFISILITAMIGLIFNIAASTAFAATVNLSAGFDSGSDGFVYADDTFNGTSSPAYASGDYVASGGYSGGGLSVTTGGIDAEDIFGMSGGWSADFNLDTAGTVTVSLRYRLLFSGAHEGNECAQALVAVDGTPIGPDGSNVLAELCGSDPQSNVDQDSGWQSATIGVDLAAGVHTLTVGGYHSQKTASSEDAEVLFDDIQVTSAGAADTTAPTWDGGEGICTAQDNQSGGSVTIEFGAASDDVDGANVRYNVYYASSSAWDGADWSNNTLLSDVAPGSGSGCSNAYTLTGLANDTPYTIGVRVADQSGNEDTNTVTVDVTPTSGGGPGGPFLSAGFDSGSNGFVYADDTFNGTSSPAYASGDYVASGGYSGGGLSVVTGGIDDEDILGMSGGWSADFNLDTAGTVTVSLRYRLLFSGAHEGNECAQALASVDGAAIGPGGSDMLAEFCGSDPSTNIDQDSGWRQASIDVSLSSGVHTLTVGGYHSQKTASAEDAEVLFDDIQVTSAGAADTTAPTWDGGEGICTAQDNQSGGSVTIEFGAASDDVDGANVRYNIYYALSSAWDGADWSNNNLLSDIAPGSGSGCANAYTLTGLANDAPYTIGVRVADQSGNEDTNMVTVDVTPTSSDSNADGTILSAIFDSGTDGFVYADDTFNGTSSPAYTSGDYVASGGYSGGGLSVATGGIDEEDIFGMSGGWSADFSLDTAGTVTVSLRYRLLFSGAHEGNECAQALASVDAAAIGPGGSDILDELCGSDPQTNVDQDTGWQPAAIDVNLSAGVHTLTVGGYHNQKTASAEDAEILFDNIEIVGPCTAPSVRMNQPDSNHIQTSPDIFVSAFACFDDVAHAGWGVRFKLDGGISSGGDEFDDFDLPFEGSFIGVSSAEHTISVTVLDDTGTEIDDPNTQDEVTQIGVGDKYVAFGDSITFSVGDDISADDTSLDGRTTGGGYPPILDDLLTNDTGRPHRIANEGVPGDKTTDGLNRIANSLAVNSDAQTYLLLLGTNDSGGSMPLESGCGKIPGDSGYSGSFKDNIQQLIDAIVASGKAPVLGKVPITLGACSHCTPFTDPSIAARNILIQDYNAVITGGECSDLTLEPNGLIVDNGLSVAPPDFYTYFEANQAEYNDNLHPNGTGYQSMADLWFNALMP